jgi:hypothetical protein
MDATLEKLKILMIAIRVFSGALLEWFAFFPTYAGLG